MARAFFRSRLTGTIGLILALLGLTVATVFAAIPGNDDFDAATPISTLPFSEAFNTAEATTAEDDPICAGQGPTVWYTFTPGEDMFIDANTFGSNYDTTLSVYMGSRGSLEQIACNDDAVGLQSQVQFQATGGTTYYFMIGAFSSGPGGDLVFSVDVGVPPPPPPPPPPPLTMELRVNSSGRVVPKTGEATLSGTMTCSRPAYANIFGVLKQKAGRLTINGFGDTFFICEGETPWSIVLKGDNGLFAGGKAEAIINGTASGVEDGYLVEQRVVTTVSLKGKK